MLHHFLVFSLLILLLAFLTLSVMIGRKLGEKHLKILSKEKLEIVGVAESAVFGLLALLIAFTFSGAYDRFEHRRMHLVDEADMFDRAYNYTYLVPANMRPVLQQDLRDYLDCYISIFKDIPHFKTVEQDIKRANIIEEKIWVAAVKASDEMSNKTLAQVFLPEFNDMFDMAHMGYYLTRIHPPRIIFVLLVGLAVLGGFLVGYNSAETKQRRPLHSLCYVLLTAFTIYVIINMEYPRVGFIKMDVFDDLLVEVRNKMI